LIIATEKKGEMPLPSPSPTKEGNVKQLHHDLTPGPSPIGEGKK